MHCPGTRFASQGPAFARSEACLRSALAPAADVEVWEAHLELIGEVLVFSLCLAGVAGVGGSRRPHPKVGAFCSPEGSHAHHAVPAGPLQECFRRAEISKAAFWSRAAECCRAVGGVSHLARSLLNFAPPRPSTLTANAT